MEGSRFKLLSFRLGFNQEVRFRVLGFRVSELRFRA